MEIIIASLALLSILISAAYMAVAIQKKGRTDKRMWMSFGVLLSAAFLIMADMLISESELSLAMTMVDILPSSVQLWLLSSSLYGNKVVNKGIISMFLADIFIASFYFCRAFTDLEIQPPVFENYFVSIVSLILISLLVYGLASMMKNVKNLMKCGTVWSIVGLSVDWVYFCFILMGVLLSCSGLCWAGFILIGGAIPAMGVRIADGVKFLLWQKQENLIVESMRITSVTATSDASHIDDVYKELYERILLYFEVKKPYLNSDLTINDLVKGLYSNKLYISRSISQFTGRNFCQFVNYYRIIHSMECFRANPEMRIHELATTNGFNSVVSYSMAFRLFMGETPSEWCRKEKSRLLKRGK